MEKRFSITGATEIRLAPSPERPFVIPRVAREDTLRETTAFGYARELGFDGGLQVSEINIDGARRRNPASTADTHVWQDSNIAFNLYEPLTGSYNPTFTVNLGAEARVDWLGFQRPFIDRTIAEAGYAGSKAEMEAIFRVSDISVWLLMEGEIKEAFILPGAGGCGPGSEYECEAFCQIERLNPNYDPLLPLSTDNPLWLPFWKIASDSVNYMLAPGHVSFFEWIELQPDGYRFQCKVEVDSIVSDVSANGIRPLCYSKRASLVTPCNLFVLD